MSHTYSHTLIPHGLIFKILLALKINERRMGTFQHFPFGPKITRIHNTLFELPLQFVVDWRWLMNWGVARASHQFQILLRRIASPLSLWNITNHKLLLLLRHLLISHVEIVPLHYIVGCPRIGRIVTRSLGW